MVGKDQRLPKATISLSAQGGRLDTQPWCRSMAGLPARAKTVAPAGPGHPEFSGKHSQDQPVRSTPFKAEQPSTVGRCLSEISETNGGFDRLIDLREEGKVSEAIFTRENG